MWEQIRANRRRSVILLTLMFLIMMGLGLFLGFLLAPPESPTGPTAPPDYTWVLVGVLIGGVVFLIQYGVYASSPESVLLSGFAAEAIRKEDFPRLYNIVEEMTIAAGLPKVPRIYVIHEKAPNAFAFGRGDNASVAVTTGLLDLMNRDELQGVVAHEIGHIRNKDVEFMTLAAVMLGTIIVLADMGARLVRLGAAIADSGGSRRSSRSGSAGGAGAAMLIAVVIGLILMIVGPFLAQILYFASSRRREYLADASAAVFTRYPEGLASALEKIAFSGRRFISEPNRAVVPLFIVNPFERGLTGLFSTHPPVEKRIKILRSMAGASLSEYNRAAESVLGKRLIRNDGEDSEPVQVRRPSPMEAIGAMAAAAALSAADTHRGLQGYRATLCSCGLKLKIPPTFSEDEIECPRCGKMVPVPPPGAFAKAEGTPADEAERKAEDFLETKLVGRSGFDLEGIREKRHPVPPEVPEKVELPVAREFGHWQTIECSVCGQPLQLSPAFRSPWIHCPKCHVKLLFPNQVAGTKDAVA